MTWSDRMLPASFRGVAFYVENHEASTGRRLAEFEFPMIDQGQVDDLGKKTPRYKIRAFVVGQDYDLQRDKLVAACANPNTSGTLVHPYVGKRTVRCAHVSVREQLQEARAKLDQALILDVISAREEGP